MYEAKAFSAHKHYFLVFFFPFVLMAWHTRKGTRAYLFLRFTIILDVTNIFTTLCKANAPDSAQEKQRKGYTL